MRILIVAMNGSPCIAADCVKPGPDWANISAYRGMNAELMANRAESSRVIFMGDSITESWAAQGANPFSTHGFVNRGISGQTTSQMLLRFRADVIDLKPKTVVIVAGTNDIAGNAGPMSQEMIVGNIASMAELARAHGIRVMLASVLPAAAFPWAPQIRPAGRIVEINRLIRRYAERNQFGYIDFFGAMADANDGMRKEYSADGVHPNAAGYAVMNRIILRALAM